MAELIRGVVFLSAALQVLVALCSACSFTVYNNCPHTIWPATLAGAGTPQLPTTGFRLAAGESAQIPASLGWSGRIWARTGCFFDEHGEGTCQTGDCGGKLQCGGMAALPPATLFEITLATSSSTRDFYDVSLVDGYNLPVYAAPRGSAAACNATGCISDLNSGCPQELQVEADDGGGGVVVACRSACEAFGLDEYCCSGEYADPTTCRPSTYSAMFKAACPRAYSYAFDDSTSTFTCNAPEYAITFCPTSTSFKASVGVPAGHAGSARGQAVGDSQEVASSSDTSSSSFSSLALLLLSALYAWSL